MSQKNVLSPLVRTCLYRYAFTNLVSFLVLTLSIFLCSFNIYSAQDTLLWDANSEDDLAGYKVHYGVSSGNYYSHEDVGNQTSYALTGLGGGNDYYLAVTAYDFSGNESAYSNEVIFSDQTSVNYPPVFSPIGNKTVHVNQALHFTISATDPEGDTLIYAASNLPSGAIFNENTKTFSWTPTYSQIGMHNISFQVNDGIVTDSQVVAITVIGTELLEIPFETGVATEVTNNKWSLVTLEHNYVSMIVICSPNYDKDTPSIVVRVQNTTGNQFEMNVQRTDGLEDVVTGIVVHYMVVEEGVYTEATHGVKMEAVKFTSKVTDNSKMWTGEEQEYANLYNSPVVVGQVMSTNDPNFSVFWNRGSSRAKPPTGSSLWVGKHVAEDPLTIRSNELIGYIVFETSEGLLGDIPYKAGLGADSVKGISNAPPYRYSLGSFSSASTAIVTLSAMDGTDGGWAVLYGPDPVSTTGLSVAIDEDQLKDVERKHTTEQVAYIVFEGSQTVNVAPVLDAIEDITVNESDTITLNPKASDPDGDALTFSYSGWMTSGSYTTNYNDAGTHTVTVTVSDGVSIDSQDVTITVVDVMTHVNAAPLLDHIDSIAVNEGDTVTLVPTATDPDGDPLTFSYSGWMTSASYDTSYDDAGDHIVTVTVSDGAASDSQSVTVTVNNVDITPQPDLSVTNLTVSSNQAYEIVENGLQNGELVYIDRGYTYSAIPVWMEGVTYIKTANNDKASSSSSFLSFDVNKDVIVYVAHDDRITPKPSWLKSSYTDIGEDLVTTDTTLSLYASNVISGTITLGGNEGVRKSMYTVVIVGQEEAGLNNAPVLDPLTNITVNEGDTVTLNPTATDPDGDALTFSYSGWMTSSNYTASYQDAGTHTVTVTVSDGTASDSQSVTVTVTNVNRAPVLDAIALL